MATATARFSSITGEALAKRSRSYRPTTRAQSVASDPTAPACSAAIAAWIAYGTDLGRGHGAFGEDQPLGNGPAVPERTILVSEQDQVAVGGRACGPPRFVQQHQREESDRLGVRQQRHQQPGRADRLSRQVGARQRRPARSGVALVEDKIDHAQHRLQAERQIGALRHFVRNLRFPDLRLGAHDPLRDRRRRGQEGVADLLGGESADLPEASGRLAHPEPAPGGSR
jgi:hypothetical protein